jgi:hypothetical protein
LPVEVQVILVIILRVVVIIEIVVVIVIVVIISAAIVFAVGIRTIKGPVVARVSGIIEMFDESAVSLGDPLELLGSIRIAVILIRVRLQC